MLSFSIDGSILMIVGTGTTSVAERTAFYAALREDPSVPERALLLLDARRADTAKDVRELEERTHLIAHLLGPKMGPFCAVIAPPRMTVDAVFFQAAGGELGIRVAIFNDEPDARKWLEGLAGQG